MKEGAPSTAEEAPNADRADRTVVSGTAKGRVRGWIRRLAVDNAPLILIAIAYAIGARLLASRLGIEDDRLPGLISLRDGWTGGSRMALFFLLGVIYMGVVVNPLRRRLRARRGDSRPVEMLGDLPVRISSIVVVYVFLALFMDSFVFFKRAIPLLNPFRWDPTFHAVDTFLHFGIEPWRITHAVLGWPLATLVLDWIYALWIPLGALVVTLVAFSMDRDWRTRFFISYMGVWFLLGTVMATMLSSAGPCFFGRLLAIDPYADLMTRLGEINGQVKLTSLALQDGLWANYVTPTDSLVKGISAMPSIHIGLVVLFWLAFKARHKWLGWIFGIYALLVLVATVHLGWHYVIDGYIAAIGAWGIWVGSGPLSRWYLARTGGDGEAGEDDGPLAVRRAPPVSTVE